jgi:hypothetical protein
LNCCRCWWITAVQSSHSRHSLIACMEPVTEAWKHSSNREQTLGIFCGSEVKCLQEIPVTAVATKQDKHISVLCGSQHVRISWMPYLQWT